MKIAQITPGLIPIPPNGWGAVEKIIWAYTQELKKLGHEVDIKYSNHISKDEYDIVHVHVANLALELAEREIPYVFTMHDHHSEVYGKDSFNYKQNLEAIEKSIFSMVPSEHLIEYFGSPHNLRYLPHGVDNNFFTPSEVKEPIEHKLLCVGKNGYFHDPKFDRKGFGYAIEAAKILNLPITIAGPEANWDSLNELDTAYPKLTVSCDLSEEDLKEEYSKHTIFLHPSIIEAGHPNLTLLESMAAGLPIVGSYTGKEFELNGIKRVSRDSQEIADAISEVINNYSQFKANAISNAKSLNWDKVVSRLDTYFFSAYQSQKFLNNHLSIYRKVSEIQEIESLDKIYIINLKVRQDRKDRITELLKKEVSLSKVEFIEATDVRNLGNKDLQQFLDANNYKVWNWKIQKNDYVFGGFDFEEWDSRELTKGEIGCAISHYRVWKDAQEKGYDKILVLEDDAYWETGELSRAVNLTEKHDFEIAYLGRTKVTNTKEEKLDENFVVPDFAYTTHAYILKKPAIDKLIKSNYNLNLIPSDEFLFSCVHEHRRPDVATLYPKILKAIAADSLIEQKGMFHYKESDVSEDRKFSYTFHDSPKVEISNTYVSDQEFQAVFSSKGEEVFSTTLRDNTWASLRSKRRDNSLSIKIFNNRDNELVSHHSYNDQDQKVLVWFDSKSLGDNIAWIPQVERYRKESGAKVIVTTFWNNIFEPMYPDLEFALPGTTHDVYASYRIGCGDGDSDLHKTPWNTIPLSQVCSDILDIEYQEETAKVKSSGKPRQINEKYVCISTSSTAGCKHWHNWQGVVDYLNNSGYKVIVIQKEPLDYMDLKGLNDVIFPDNKDIFEAINWIEHCEFFIGLSSGVSWLANALGKKVVMISGFTKPFNEFSCTRLIKEDNCNGCWHSHKFDRGDWRWCPEHKDTDREFECMKSIKVQDVINALPIKV